MRSARKVAVAAVALALAGGAALPVTAQAAAMKPRTGDGPLEVTKEDNKRSDDRAEHGGMGDVILVNGNRGGSVGGGSPEQDVDVADIGRRRP